MREIHREDGDRISLHFSLLSKKMKWMDKILYEDDDTEDYLDSILLNPVASSIS
jgi:hypothetical protein